MHLYTQYNNNLQSDAVNEVFTLGSNTVHRMVG